MKKLGIPHSIANPQTLDLPPGQLPLPRLLQRVRHPLGLQLLQPPPGWGAPASPASARPLYPQLEADVGLGIIIHIFRVKNRCPVCVFSHSLEYFILDKYFIAFQHVSLVHRNDIACIDLANENANKMNMIQYLF